jgi:hypothetical protein
MPDEYRVTIRLSPALYAQLEARGSQGQPLAAIVRDALLAYLSRQPETPDTPEHLTETVAAMAASLADLQRQVQRLVARVDSLTAIQQPEAASQEEPLRQPAAAMADVAAMRDLLAAMQKRLEALEGRFTDLEAASLSGSQRQPEQGLTPQPSPQILGTYDPRSVAQRILALRQQGLSFEAIAVQLTQEGIPTRYGLPWQHSSVRHLFNTYKGEPMQD